MGRKIYLHRLGCPKLDVDHDLLAAGLAEQGAVFVEQTDSADTVIISTCAFIGDARAEAVEAMLEGANWKSEAANRSLYVTGCLPARYQDSLRIDLPEVDGWFGPGQFEHLIHNLSPDVKDTLQLDSDSKPHIGRVPRALEDLLANLRRAEESPVAYLKIAEGCNRRCAYCAIPDIRGPYTSRRPGSILSEASRLLSQGVREIIVTAQEVNSYGFDLDDGIRIEQLLPRLGEIVAKEDGWLRVLYTHPPLFTEAFVQALTETPAFVPYLDFPIEHTDDAVLKAMGRGITWAEMQRWIDLLRSRIPDIALRTSVIVGHPGERDAEFRTLLTRLNEVHFERLGVFRYSPEEGTKAAKRSAPTEEAAVARELEVQELALDHADEWYRSRVGRTTEMLVEAIGEDNRPRGRTLWDAPDIDGEAVFVGNAQHGDIVCGVIREAEPFTMTLEPTGP
ncbi:MAG: MiaB/RimO family radical SAM methylthiotransferase [bacterium]